MAGKARSNILSQEDSTRFADDCVASGLRTLSFELEGLQSLRTALAGDLAHAFVRAIELLIRLRGKVIVSGVGKSGHIGAKIAATLASTGTPAFFVHPAEANHGDLGMISGDDAILAISLSGETSELAGIINFSKRFSVPLIAMTAVENSTLAREAGTVLLVPKAVEACPHGLAPTTSAIMQLATGDAIAVALLESRGFTPDNFRAFHPGGKLGANLKQVGDIMHTGSIVPLVDKGTSIPEAVMILSERRFGCVGVLDDAGGLSGIVTDGDLARNLNRDLSQLPVDRIMTDNPKTVEAETLASSAMAVLNMHKISALFVVEGRQPIGIIHIHDLLRAGVA